VYAVCEHRTTCERYKGNAAQVTTFLNGNQSPLESLNEQDAINALKRFGVVRHAFSCFLLGVLLLALLHGMTPFILSSSRAATCQQTQRGFLNKRPNYSLTCRKSCNALGPPRNSAANGLDGGFGLSSPSRNATFCSCAYAFQLRHTNTPTSMQQHEPSQHSTNNLTQDSQRFCRSS
jgi:hypothetical protein